MPMRERGTRQLIQQLVSSEAGKRELSQCVQMFNRIAMGYLKRKIANGTLTLNRIQLKLEDFAWDCVAGLFERDKKGAYVQLQSYFEDYDLTNMSDQEVFSACRRLVFSKVNDGIFRNFRRIDPALGKIIRNLKLAIKKNSFVTLESEKDMSRVIFKEEISDSKPLMPVEILRIRLTQRLEATMFISESLEVIHTIMNGQDWYRSEYPLVELSKILRYAYTQLHDNAEGDRQTVYQNNPLYEKNMQEFIRNSIDKVQSDMYNTYVEKDKLDKQTFELYFECIEDILFDFFVEEGKTSTYFEHLQGYLDQISRDTYREQHRGYLEYLVKKARSDLLHKLKKEF